ncbi:MAG TPA: hypothetical protein VFV63_14930 [Ilumatobacteraceae bacterium]|nr:hypothetical protein [Ilumatobacteraceae bacterium]
MAGRGEAGTAGRVVGGGKRPAVTFDELAGDREAEAAAAGVGRAGESVEDPLDIAIDAGAGVGNRDRDGLLQGGHGDGHGSVGRGVSHSVREQVGHHLTEAHRVGVELEIGAGGADGRASTIATSCGADVNVVRRLRGFRAPGGPARGHAAGDKVDFAAVRSGKSTMESIGGEPVRPFDVPEGPAGREE